MIPAAQTVAYLAAGLLGASARGIPRRYILTGLACDLARLATFTSSSPKVRLVDGMLALAPCLVFAWPSFAGRYGAAVLAGVAAGVAHSVDGWRDRILVAAYAGILIGTLPFVFRHARSQIERLLVLALTFSALVGASLFAFWEGDDWGPINVSNLVSCLLLSIACLLDRRDELKPRIAPITSAPSQSTEEQPRIKTECREVDQGREPEPSQGERGSDQVPDHGASAAATPTDRHFVL